MERYVQVDDLVVDVGCGSGVLSIASLLLGARHVLAYDLDEVAVNSTKANATLNRVDHEVDVLQSDLLSRITDTQADIVVSNILAEIIVQLTSEAKKNLKMGGLFITSGIIKDKKKMVLDNLHENGFEIIDTTELDGWISIVGKKI